MPLPDSDDQYDIEVELTLYPTDQGGRRHPMLVRPDNHSPHIALDHHEWMAAFVPKDRNREWLFPGETATMFVFFFYHPEALSGRLWVGREFLLNEAGWSVGKGVITAMLNFEQHVKEYTVWLRPHEQAADAE